MTNLPNDPVAAADALISAFKGKSRRDSIVLPSRLPSELSDNELDNQPCVVVQGGAKTYAGLPLSKAPPGIIERFVGVKNIANFDAFDPARLRYADLPWLGGQLALLPDQEGKIEVPFFVNKQNAILADRTNEWIYQALSLSPPPLLNADLIAYTRFFFATVVGKIGAFSIADRTEDALWLPSASRKTKQELRNKLEPLRTIGVAEDGRLELRSTVIFKNALFVCSILVAPNWEIELAKEQLLIDELPIEFGDSVSLLVRR
jgi:hypothetical protein